MTSLLFSLILFGQVPSEPYQWRNIEIVGGGFVTGVITHPRAKDLLYCRTDIGGAYRWNPKTNRWIPLQDWIIRPEWNLYGVESLAVDPTDPNRVYIAAGTYTNEWGGNGAILRSKDRGDTWERTDLPFKNGGNEDGRSIGERLSVDPSDGRVIYFGTRHNGLLRSDDYGATWKLVDRFPIKGRTNRIGIGWVLFDPRRSEKGRPTKEIYVGVAVPGTTLYRSRDAGATWEPVPGQPPTMLPHQAKFGPDGRIYIVYGDQPGPNGVTNGAVWSYDPASERWSDITPEKPGPGNAFGYGGVAIDPNNPGTIMVSTLCRWSRHDTVFRTTDSGKKWISLGDSSVRDASKAPYLLWARPEAEFGHWIGDVEIDPHNPDRAWYVTGATIWGTENLRAADRSEKTHWLPRAEGLEETAVIDLISPLTGAHVISALGDIAGFAHTDLNRSPSGGMWTNPLWNTTTDLDYAGLQPNLVVRVGYGNGPHIAISEDGGLKWQPLAKEPPGNRPAGSAAISSDGLRIVYAPENTPAHLTLDRGQTWVRCQGAPERGRVFADKADPTRFLIHDREAGRTYISPDGGRTFQPGANGLPTEGGKIQAAWGKRGHFWYPSSQGIFRSIDGGNTFQKVEGAEFGEQIGFGKEAPGKTYPTLYLIGRVKGIVGVFRSTDEGATWTRINDAKTGFGTMQVIEGDPKVFGRVYVGCNGRGVLVADPRGKA
ncbi:MAG TPA: xyloglucanase [Fimbriimonadaceae bacterium]|nr:xyloglucanase [Fimbriimonadaceae bacterium]